VFRVFRQPIPNSRHYHVIDVVRGLAAIAILFWHYQHFIVLGMAEPGTRSGYPLYRMFALFYEQGGAAVQLFWIISGFVFAAVYAGSGVTAGTFFHHRFARLYPLHFVTLLVVAALQAVCMWHFGRALIYSDNSMPTFLLHLVMANGWTSATAASFNGPIWSVSAEVLIYGLFWLSLRHLFRWGLALPVAAAGVFLALSPLSPIAACGGYFFIGCAVYIMHRALPVSLQIGGAFVAFAMFAGLLSAGLQGVAVLFLFAGGTLACAALEESAASRWASRVPWVADNTYGVYLWHIPVQLILLLSLSALGISRTVALSPWFLALFVGTVVCLARASFLYIERPARSVIRNRFRPNRPDKMLEIVECA
jgi:peptidoglycan/LPS O-acetylase OafA/YrhL